MCINRTMSFFHSQDAYLYSTSPQKEQIGLVHSFVRSFVRAFACLFDRLFVHSFVRALTHSFACSFVRSLVRLFGIVFHGSTLPHDTIPKNKYHRPHM